MKTATLESKFPLLAVEHGCIISKDADITVAYRVELPELFTLTRAEYEAVHSTWAKAVKVLPILLYVNELREQCSIPRICLTDQQILELIDTRAKAAGADTLTATAEYIAPLAGAEWTKHRDDVLWNPDEAKKKAKEEDEKRNKEALAAKFAHIKDDPGKETVEL